MGAIIKGRDVDLGRDLAIKVLLESHKDKPDVIQRFVEEAQIGGQLQHPGIAPVYELGQFADHRPFFSMKLVKGETLAKLLADRADATADRAKLLGIFEQVCQTMAYAHSRGVIHRDLKPANIMVGAFGEVQVMDWGLAKVLSQGGIEDERRSHGKHKDVSVIQTLRSVGSDAAGTYGSFGSDTQMGSVMGTPAYMPPEQALGEIDQLDERADVFGLGAILAEILTGKPPYVAEDGTQVFRMSSRGKLDACFARLEQSGADPELLAITHQCLELEPQDRPRDAGGLAQRVTSYLESVETRLRDAELARVEANTRATEERKRRKVLMALAASVLVTLSAAAGGWIWLKHKDGLLARAESAALLEQQIRSSRLQQQIAGELSTARTLTDHDPERASDRVAIERALAAIARANDAIAGAREDSSHSSEIRSLATELDQLQASLNRQVRDHELVIALEDAMLQEKEFRAAIRQRLYVEAAATWRNQTRNDHNNTARSDGSEDETDLIEQSGYDAIDQLQSLDPISAYEAAFAEWGLFPESPVEETSVRLRAVHPSQQPLVMTCLDRWRMLLAEPRVIEQWQAAAWADLTPVSLESRGGDRLRVLEDGSILAGGDNAWAGYELVFDTDATEISALRLEALLHPSLPNLGPGRCSHTMGMFKLMGLEVWLAPKADLSKRSRVAFASAIADYSWTDAPISVHEWNITFGAGKPHQAVFALSESVRSESGFRIWITNADQPRNEYENQGLGRFRWSCSSDNSVYDIVLATRQLYRMASAADTSDWRKAIRSEYRDSDWLALIERGLRQQQVTSQSSHDLVLLSEILSGLRNEMLFEAIPDSVQWHAVSDPVISTESGTVYQMLDDGSFLATGPNPRSESTTITLPATDAPLTAIRLDFIPDDRSAFKRPSWGRSDWGGVHIHGLSLVSSAHEQFPGAFEHAISDYFLDVPADALFDENEVTRANFVSTVQPTSLIATVSPMRIPHGETVHLQIRTGLKHESNPGLNPLRFRVSYSTSDLRVDDVHESALSLLQRAGEKAPSDYWLRLALAEVTRTQQPPRLDESLRHASAAIALRPDQSGGLMAVLHTVTLEALLDTPDRVPEVASLLRRLTEIDPKHPAVSEIRSQLTNDCDRYFREGNLTEWLKRLDLMTRLFPGDIRLLITTADRLIRTGHTEKAIGYLLQAEEIDAEFPGLNKSLGRHYLAIGDEHNAVKYFRKEIDLQEHLAGRDAAVHLGGSYVNLAGLALNRGWRDEAIELLRSGHDSMQTTPVAGIWRAYAQEWMLLGDLAEAESAIRNSIAIGIHQQVNHLELAEILAGREQYEEASRTLQIAIDRVDQTNQNQLENFALRLAVTEHLSVRFSQDAVVIARKAVAQNRGSTSLSALCRACYRNGDWQDAIDTSLKIMDASFVDPPLAWGRISAGFVLAMAYWQQNEPKEALARYHAARKLLNESVVQPPPDIVRIGDEAGQLLGVEVPSESESP